MLDGALDLAAALVGMAGFGSCGGVTIAVLERRPPAEVELWGLRGTAVGFLVGIFVMAAAIAAQA